MLFQDYTPHTHDVVRRLRVMVVDDDPAIIQVLHKILGDDYDVRFALSGADALRMIDAAAPDMLLLDIEMPQMSGVEVCRQLKANPAYARLPVLFATGHTETGMEIEALHAGGSDFIQKPLVPELVRARVRIHALLVTQSEKLREMVYVDGLTGLYNRRKFDEALENEWRWCRRRAAAFSILLLDIDHFKLYNDHYGHIRGDQCLEAVAKAAKRCLRRPHDLAARYGGEEFVFLLPDTGQDDAMKVAEDILAAVTALKIPHEASPVAGIVTASIGVAGTVPAGDHAGGLLEQADRALYRAKHHGRNQTVAAAGIMPNS